MSRRYNLPWAEYAATLKPHEQPMMPGSPASPDHPAAVRLAYAAVAVLVILTGSLGNAVVSANLQNLQGALGVDPVQIAWLPIVFVMANACLGLILVKFRQQYGLRLFTQIFLVGLVAVSFAHLFVDDFSSAIAVRFAAGMAASGLSTLGILYMLQAFPPAHRLKGLILGISGASFAAPIARLVAPALLDIGGWPAFHVLELGLSLLSLAATFVLRLPPSERFQAFDPLDFVTFVLFAAGIALLAAVLGLGRIVWWTQAPWIGWSLAGSVLLLTASILIEYNRRRPLINLKWLAGPDILRLGLSILLVRVVLSEQTAGSVGFLQQLGVGPDQLHGLFWVILAATVAGSLVSSLTLNLEKLNLPIAVALGLIAVGAYMDSDATSLTRPVNLFFSQALLAFAAALFIGPALLIGVTQVLRHGPQNMVSFIVLFSVGQNVGGLAGSALVGTVETLRQRVYFNDLTAHLTLTDPNVALRVQQLGGAYARVVGDADKRGVEGLRLLTQQATQQSHVLAYNDVFRMIAVVAALGCLWVTILHLKKRLQARRTAAQAEATAVAAAAME